MKLHLHLIVDAKVKNPPRDEATAKDWFERLVAAIDMEKLGGPWATYCDDPANRGLTGQVWLTTSHSAFHFWDNTDEPFVKFDVYSCRDYEVETVMEMLKEFDMVSGAWTLLDRSGHDTLPIITQGTFKH